MKFYTTIKRIKRTGAVLLALGLALMFAQPVNALSQSSKVGFVTTPSVVNGGTLPTTAPAFSGFTFSNVPIVGTNPLDLSTACGGTACDTVVLNTASSTTIRCNLATVTDAQKAELVSFVNNGGKLILIDSECSAQNYSWLPYPFTTNNPGAQGAQGTLTIVEENNLSTTNPLDQFYINANMIATQTDAIGDMNVMTTLDSNWCLDMSGTNANQVTGPVQTYARYGSGLFIYNGMDTDVLSSGTVPSNTNGTENFAKIWLQQLQVPFNPTPLTALPCGSVVTGINITPLTAVNDLNAGETSHTVTAHIEDQLNNPIPNKLVTFEVLAGSINAGATGACSANVNCNTDANGDVSFTYSSNGNIGNDNIEACFINSVGTKVCSQTAKKEWVSNGGPTPCDVNGDNQIDKTDLAQISKSRGQTPTAGDPRDANQDGKIDPRDVKICIPQCTFAQCAVQ
jgi:hypothetical protein